MALISINFWVASPCSALFQDLFERLQSLNFVVPSSLIFHRWTSSAVGKIAIDSSIAGTQATSVVGPQIVQKTEKSRKPLVHRNNSYSKKKVTNVSSPPKRISIDTETAIRDLEKATANKR
jgi:hypothetical protein